MLAERRPLIVAALGRFAKLLVAITVVIVLGSALVGLAAGASLSRSISLGFYIVGSFLVIGGFFLGNRGPLRARGDTGLVFFRRRGVRRATPAERDEAINMSAVFVAIGFILILAGIAADPRYHWI